MRGRCRDERGQVIVLGAVMIPVLLLLAALVIDVGNWYTHKRQLQNRADAAAFAAAVEYGKTWKACVQTANPTLKTKTAQEIANAARQYAADPDAADYNKPATIPVGMPPTSVYNSEIANQGKLDVAINSTSYDDNTDYSDGAPALNNGDPCFKHTTADSISAPGYWTDVKVKERDLPSLFGGIGLPLSRNGARARVDIRPAISGTRFLPLAVPEQRHHEGAGAVLRRVPRTPCSTRRISRPAADQAAYATAGGGMLWGIPNGNPNESAIPASPFPSRCRPTIRPAVTTVAGRHRGPGREPGRHRSESELRGPPGAQVRGLLPPPLADPDLERRQRDESAADHPGSSDRAAAAA